MLGDPTVKQAALYLERAGVVCDMSLPNPNLPVAQVVEQSASSACYDCSLKIKLYLRGSMVVGDYDLSVVGEKDAQVHSDNELK